MEATKVAAHTPGPWRAYKRGDGTTLEITRALLGEPGRRADGVCNIPTDYPNCEANAALLAAAPDLLAVLCEIMEAVDTEFAEISPAIGIRASAAIAKAQP